MMLLDRKALSGKMFVTSTLFSASIKNSYEVPCETDVTGERDDELSAENSPFIWPLLKLSFEELSVWFDFDEDRLTNRYFNKLLRVSLPAISLIIKLQTDFDVFVHLRFTCLTVVDLFL